MSEETHAEFMARIKAMSSASHRSPTQRATIVGSASSSIKVVNGATRAPARARNSPAEAKANHLARLGYGFEDIAKLCDLPPEAARRIVFKKRTAWNVWVFGKRGVQA